jgi:hypothetical protein
MATVALFRFAEVADEVFAVDDAGSSHDLGDDPGSTPALGMPPVVTSLTGRGREFGDDLGLQADEAVSDSLRLLRDCTVRAFLSYAIGQHNNGDRGTLCLRGVQGSTAERMLFGVEFERIDATTLELRARWEEGGGTDAVVAGAQFTCPDGFFHVAVVRRWLTTTSVTVEYYVNDELIGSETVSEGDIGEGSGGTLTVGCAGDGAGNYEHTLPDGSIIDMLSIEDDAMSAEEIRQDFRAITVHQPAGGKILRAYIPPGSSWKRDPSSRVQRWIAAEGDGLGAVLSAAARLREDFLPDRAYGAALEYWERLTGNAPMPSDTISERRDRVVGFLSRVLGYQLDDLKHSLETLFGLDSSQIEILEYDGLRTDDFSTDDITTPPSKIWVTRDGAGSVAIAAGGCVIDAQLNDDVSYATGEPPHRETSLSPRIYEEADGATLVTKHDIAVYQADLFSGHLWRTADKANAIVIGVHDVAGTRVIGAQIVEGYVAGAIVDYLLSVPDPLWLLTRYVGGGVYEVAYSATGPTSGFGSALQITGGPEGPLWCGFGVFGEDAALGGAAQVKFDDAHIYEPNGTRGLAWQAYRDPGLGGTYDMVGAELQIDKQGPAHAAGSAVTSKTGFTLGPTGTGKLGIDPLYPADQYSS